MTRNSSFVMSTLVMNFRDVRGKGPADCKNPQDQLYPVGETPAGEETAKVCPNGWQAYAKRYRDLLVPQSAKDQSHNLRLLRS